MDGVARTWISSTLATETVALAAARATLACIIGEDVCAHLHRVGNRGCCTACIPCSTATRT